MVPSLDFIKSTAVQVFGSVTAAETWLSSSNVVFNFSSPYEVAESPAGAIKVMDLLNRRKPLVSSGLA